MFVFYIFIELIYISDPGILLLLGPMAQQWPRIFLRKLFSVLGRSFFHYLSTPFLVRQCKLQR